MAKKKVKKAVKKAKKAVKKVKKAAKKVKKAAKKPVKKAKKAVKKVKNALKKVKKAAKKAPKMKKAVKKAVKPANKVPHVKKAAPVAAPKKVAHPYMRAPVIPVRQPTMGGATKLSMPMPASDRPVGIVTHYYDRIGVGVLKLREPLKVGEMIRVQKGETTFTQPVTSMQISRQKVQQANANDDVALKMEKPAHEGARIYRA